MVLESIALLSFDRLGYYTHRGALSASSVRTLACSVDDVYAGLRLEAHRQKVRVLLGEEALRGAETGRATSTLKNLKRLLADVPSGAVPFLQSFNLWRRDPAIAAIATELAPHAAALLGTERVRLYQDSLFIKRVGDGPTPWHSDLAMSPLDTNDFVTAWVPLQPVPSEEEGGSGLVFARASHRDVALHFWHGEPTEQVDASGRGYGEGGGHALDIGDVTWHHGWTLHACNGNRLKQARRAMAFSYFNDGATRLCNARRAVHDEDEESYQAWLSDVPPGRPATHALLPIVWDRNRPVAIKQPRSQTLDTAGGPARETTSPREQRKRPQRRRRAGQRRKR